MGHEKVLALSLHKKTKECWCTSYSSNVSPKTPERWEIKGISSIYKNSGEEAAIKELLMMYWGGTFQPGTKNLFYKAVSIFTMENPTISYGSVGEVLDEDLFFGPLEDLPKYLNVESRRVQDILKSRLNGVTYDRDTTELQVLITKEDLLNRMYESYRRFKNRVKGKFIIGVGSAFFSKPCGKHSYYTTYDRERAMVFNSTEDAAVLCSQYGFEYKRIINLTEPVASK